MLISETYINRTENHLISEPTEPYEPWTEDTGKLYRTFQREYGRCIGKVYIDTAERTIPCGWVFQGRDKYEDSDETYLREVWVTLYDSYTRKTTVQAEPHALAR